jgi:hypothetical protein
MRCPRQFLDASTDACRHHGAVGHIAQGTQPFDEAINADMTSDRGSMLNILTLVGNFPGMIALRALQNGNKG